MSVGWLRWNRFNLGRNPLAIRKGMSAEYLAKAHFSKLGYAILSPDCHESHYDFIIDVGDFTSRVQVKSVLSTSFNLARIRNKHGATNKLYLKDDYDILAGVWVEKNKIYLFNSKDINETNYGECITVERLDGTTLTKGNRPRPYYQGDI